MQYYCIIASQVEVDMSLERKVGRFLFDLRDVASDSVNNAITVELRNMGVDPVNISKCLQIVKAEHIKIFSNATNRLGTLLEQPQQPLAASHVKNKNKKTS